MGHARALLPLQAAQQVAAASRVVAQALSVRDTERLVQTTLHPGSRRKTRGTDKSANADVARLENELADALGAQVRIESGRKGTGRVVIAYSSLDQLDGILARLKK